MDQQRVWKTKIRVKELTSDEKEKKIVYKKWTILNNEKSISVYMYDI